MSLIYDDDDMQGGISVGGVPLGGIEMGGRITGATRAGQANYLTALKLLKQAHPDKPARAMYQAMKARGMNAAEIVASLSGHQAAPRKHVPARKTIRPRAKAATGKGRAKGRKVCPHCQGSGFWDDFAHGFTKGLSTVADIAPKVLPFVL